MHLKKIYVPEENIFFTQFAHVRLDWNSVTAFSHKFKHCICLLFFKSTSYFKKIVKIKWFLRLPKFLNNNSLVDNYFLWYVLLTLRFYVISFDTLSLKTPSFTGRKYVFTINLPRLQILLQIYRTNLHKFAYGVFFTYR